MITIRNSKSVVSNVVVFILLFLGLGLSLVSAQIEIEVDREFTVTPSDTMSVRETETLTNRFPNQFIPAGSSRSYFFVISTQEEAEREKIAEEIYSTLSVYLNGREINYSRIQENGVYGVSYKLRQSLDPNETQDIRVTYIHPELSERVGGLLDAYIPAFTEDFSFSSENTNYRYLTRLNVPKDSGRENIVSVEPLNKFQEGDYDVYIFDQESLLGSFVWVQRGSKQVYEFEITQPILRSETTNSGNLVEYQVVIPRDIQEVNVSQKVYFSNLNPKPERIETDDQGNLIGFYRIPANESRDIVIEGYAVVTADEDDEIKAEDVGTLADINLDQVYLNEAPYWEVNAAEIQERAQSIAPEAENVYSIVETTYGEVIEQIDYSQVKRFGINERQGALATLQGGAAVCMEYSDLYLTLLRSKGVPARAVFGYGYDSRLETDEQEPHQWVQTYLPGPDNWMSADVTWGESGPDVIGGDLNHFYTHVAAEDPNTPSVLSRVSFLGGSAELVPPKFNIRPLAEIPESIDESDLTSTEDLISEYSQSEIQDSFEFYLDSISFKYQRSWQNLFSNPGANDLQGWLLIMSTVILLAFLGNLIRIVLIKSKNSDNLS